MSRLTRARVLLMTMSMAAIATVAMAQERLPTEVGVGVVLREGDKNLPKAWVASASFPISHFVSIEFAGYGAYVNEPDEVEGPGINVFAHSHEIVAGARVTPYFNNRVRTFGHFLVGPRFTTFGLKDNGAVALSDDQKLAVVHLGAGIDVGGRRVSGRVLYDRVFAKVVKTTDDLDDKNWGSSNRLTASIVFGF